MKQQIRLASKFEKVESRCILRAGYATSIKLNDLVRTIQLKGEVFANRHIAVSGSRQTKKSRVKRPFELTAGKMITGRRINHDLKPCQTNERDSGVMGADGTALGSGCWPVREEDQCRNEDCFFGCLVGNYAYRVLTLGRPFGLPEELQKPASTQSGPLPDPAHRP